MTPINPLRAIAAFLIAALVPCVHAMLHSPTTLESWTPVDSLVMLAIVYAFALPFVFVVGAGALWLSLRVKYGPFFIPPLFGAGAMFLFQKMTYNADTDVAMFLPMMGVGALTAIVASIVYFLPEIMRTLRVAT